MEEENTTTTTDSGLDSGLDEETTEGTNTEAAESSTGEGNNTEANEETAADSNTSQNVNSSKTITGDDSQSVGANNDTNDFSLGAVGIASIVFGVIFAVLTLASLWKMLEKLGEKGWKVLIPIYNIYVLLKVAFGSNNQVANSTPKDEFNFDDNLANINKFNNDVPDYDSSMAQSSRFEPNNSFENGINPDTNNEFSNSFPGINNNFDSNNNMGLEENNQNEMPNQEPNPGIRPMMKEEPMNNNMQGMMPNEMPNQEMNPDMGPMMNGGQMNNGMPGMMPNEMPSPMPEPNQNNQFNNGPMPMPGTGPNGMTKQCPNCHAPVPLNLVVCPNCGANVGGMN